MSSRSTRRLVAAAAAVTAGETSVNAFLKAQIEEMIALQPVIVFSKSRCPYCSKAKQALQDSGVEFALCELNDLGEDTESQVQDVLAEITGARTVPRVFMGGKFIGGGDDTSRLAAEGKLASIAKEALESYQRKVAGKEEFQLTKSMEEWKSSLDPKQFRVLRQRGTEPPFSHPYDKFLPEAGHFSCAACSLPLYSASSKFASNCGWPVFNKCYGSSDLGQHVRGQPDGTGALEIMCSRCGSHLGHVFYDSVNLLNPNGERH